MPAVIFKLPDAAFRLAPPFGELLVFVRADSKFILILTYAVDNLAA